MRQDHDVEAHAAALRSMNAANAASQLRLADELLGRERANGDHQLRPQQTDFAIEMRCAIGDLERMRHAITAAPRIASGKTSDDGAHVDARAKLCFVDAERLEPTEQTTAGGVCEWPSIFDLMRTGRLTHEHDFRAFNCACHRFAENVRAHAACVKRRQVLRKSVAHGNRRLLTWSPMKRFLVLLLFPLTANAWTPASDHQIADRAARLAPHDLNLLIKRFHKQYVAGIDYGIREEHGTDVRRGQLRERIDKETRGTIGMIRSNQPMSQVIARMGLLAHLIGDANNPFHVSTEEALDQLYPDFEGYFERRMQKFPTVFYGLDSQFALQHYLERTFKRTASFSPLVREEYFRGGRMHTSADFDDRSTAFGVASICYSHAVTDIVNLYYYIWKQSGGDVRLEASMRGARVIQNAN